LEAGHKVSKSNSNNSHSNFKSGGSSDIMYDEGVKRVFKIKLFPLLWDDSEAIAMVLDDITQQRIITQLKQADKNKNMVIAMISHELRTPLNGMLGLIDIAKKNICHAETLSYLQACRNSGVLLLSLVNSTLDMNQISHKKLNLLYTRISIADLLEEMRSLFDYNRQLRRLYLDLEIDPEVPEFICTDKNRLSQILINLLGNAFKFTFSGGVKIQVKLSALDPLRVIFSVIDTGIGIKKEDQGRLFTMYGKIEHHDKNINTHGVGLGLTICNSLVKLLNPAESNGIEFESEVDQGTTFSFSVECQEKNLGVENSKEKDPASSSLADISSIVLNEEKDTTFMRKIDVHTITNHDNYVRMVTVSSQNIEAKKTLEPRRDTGSLYLNTIKEIDSGALGGIYSSDSGSHHCLMRKESKIDDYRDDVVIINGRGSTEAKTPTGAKHEELERKERWCLIVDDNPFNLIVACHIMEERKFKVKTALNGQEAIKQVRDHNDNLLKFDVILMDCQMPVMDGYEATSILKKMMLAKEVSCCPIIALTANNHDEDHEKLCKSVGMDGYVGKPLQINDLESELKKAQVHHDKK